MIPFSSAPALKLRSAYLQMHRAVNRLLKPLGITADQYVVLRFLAEQDGTAQQSLVDLCDSDPTTMGRMLELLEKKGVIRRRPNPTDGRSRQVFLTRKGKNLCEESYRVTAPIRDCFVESISTRELDLFTQSLQKIGHAFEAITGQPS